MIRSPYVLRPSLYAETVWEARKARAARRERVHRLGCSSNRLASVEPRNRHRVDERLGASPARGVFAPLPDCAIGDLSRLFPFGLTVSDLTRGVRPVQVSLGHIAARQELRILMHDLGLVDSGATAVAG